MYWKKHAKNTDKILIREKSQKDVRQTLEVRLTINTAKMP